MSRTKLDQVEQPAIVSSKGVVVDTPRFSRKSKSLAIVCGIVIIIGGSVGGWEYHAKSVVNADNRKFAETQAATDALGANNHFDQAASLWMKYALGSHNLAHKGAAYTNAAALYLDNNQFSQAFNACKSAETAIGMSYSEVELAAEAAQGLGRKAVAIQYYQDAIRLIPASTTFPETQRHMFNVDIQQLEAK